MTCTACTVPALYATSLLAALYGPVAGPSEGWGRAPMAPGTPGHSVRESSKHNRSPQRRA